MQTVIIAEQQRDLYHLLVALAETSYNHLSEPKFANKSTDSNRVLLWSQGSHSDLLNSPDKLEVIESHARQLGIHIVLSAAANAALRNWANQIGWTVLWQVPHLDHALDATSQSYQNYEQDSQAELETSIAS